MSVLGISLKGNEEQQEASRLIMMNDIPVVIITGAAGTGKDFVTMATFLAKRGILKLPTLVPACLKFLTAEKEKRAPRKQLYYIYGMTCILTHQTFDFTDEEKKTLNLLHDGSVDNRAEIVEWCESKLRALDY